MKTTLNYFLLALLTVFTSCSSSDDANGNGGGNGGGNQTSSSYWPFAVGNTWNLVNPENSNDKSDYLIHKTIIHDGKTYYQFKPIGIDADVELTDGVREENGVFYNLHGATSQMGIHTSAGIITSMNTKLAVGEVWTDQVTLTISGAASGSIKHNYEGKILEKVASVSINNKTYKDVIKTELKQTVLNSLTGMSFTIVYENWFAKGVGIIYEKNTYDEGSSDEYGLVSYSLK